jgi:hypothetical protein
MQTFAATIRPPTLALGLLLSLVPATLPANALIVDVLAGERTLRVESWNTTTAAWHPVAQAHLDGRAGTAKIRLPDTAASATLRVLSRPDALLAANLVHNHAEVDGWTSTASGEQLLRNYGAPEAVAGDLDTAPEEMSVERADLWTVAGDRAIIFNQYRGLQIVDLATRAEPRLAGSLRLPARGEQLYAIAGDHVLLLVNGPANTTQVRCIATAGNSPHTVARVDAIPGAYVDSRLVGNRLHLLSRVYSYGEAGYQEGFYLQSIDWHDPANPVADPPIFHAVPGYGQATATATPDYLFLALPAIRLSTGQQHNELVVYELAPDQPPAARARLLLAGVIKDLYKIHVHDGILATVAEAVRHPDSLRSPVSVLETWDLGQPSVPRLAELLLAPGETLFATRFQEHTAYIVTFEVKDPLFAVDFSDPAQPVVRGKLDIPGYSTYLAIDGDTLVSVGVEDWRVAVSLFSIADPANMFLADRAYIGAPGSYSWSEANYDDRAITIDRAGKRILVPYQVYGDEAFRQGIAVFAYGSGQLADGGRLRFAEQAPRRSVVRGDDWIAFSGSHLQTGTLADPPLLDGTLRLSWSVDYVHATPDRLLQLANIHPLRLVASAGDDPDQVLSEAELGGGPPLVGVGYRHPYLHLLFCEYWDADQNLPLRHEIWDLSDPAAPVLAGRADTTMPGVAYLTSTFQAHWAGADVLWVPVTEQRFGGWYRLLPVEPWPGQVGGAFTDAMIAPGWGWWGTWALQAARVTAADPANPQFLWTASLLDSGQVDRTFWQPPHLFAGVQEAFTRAEDGSQVYQPALRIWDFSDGLPAASDPLEIPGYLEDVEAFGAAGHVVYTRGAVLDYIQPKPDAAVTTPVYRNEEIISALLWDGVQLFQLARRRLPALDTWHTTRTFGGGRYLRAHYDWNDATHTTLQSWRLDATAGSFIPEPGFDRPDIITQLAYHHATFALRDPWQIEWLQFDAAGLPQTVTRSEVSSAVPLFFDRATIDAAGNLLVPAGAYGVESFAIGAPPPAAPGAPRIRPLSATPDWLEVPAQRWRRTEAAASDAGGSLLTRRWLFRDAGWQPMPLPAEDAGDGWRYLPAFGFFNDGAGGRDWIHHMHAGWLAHAGTQAGGEILATPGGRFLWLDPALLPWLYDYSARKWVAW